jgi:hypothetical protein
LNNFDIIVKQDIDKVLVASTTTIHGFFYYDFKKLKIQKSQVKKKPPCQLK